MPFKTPIENIFRPIERTNIEKIMQIQKEQQEMLEKMQLQQLRLSQTSNNCGFCNCGNHSGVSQYTAPKVATASYDTQSATGSSMWERLLYSFVGLVLGVAIGFYFGRRGQVKYPTI